MIRTLIAATAVAGALLTPLAATATAAPGTGHSGRGQEHADPSTPTGPKFPNPALDEKVHEVFYRLGIHKVVFPWEPRPRR